MARSVLSMIVTCSHRTSSEEERVPQSPPSSLEFRVSVATGGKRESPDDATENRVPPCDISRIAQLLR